MKDQNGRQNWRLLHGWTRIRRQDTTDEEFFPFRFAANAHVTDTQGTEFIDARSLVWNVSFGHSQPALAAAVMAQMDAMACGPTIDGQTTPIADRLADRLVECTGGHFERAYLSLSGSAANEIAIVLARSYYAALEQPERQLVVSLDKGYHGQSLGTLPLAQDENRDGIGSPIGLGYRKVPNCYCYRCPLGLDRADCGVACADAAIAKMREIGPERISAMIVEPIQGSIGHAPPVEWFVRIAAFLREHGILLIADEVATGFGRLGTRFGFEAFGFVPDMVTLGKAITNGALPLAATLVSPAVLDPIAATGWVPPFGSTQDGNPVCAAAACAVLDIFEQVDWPTRVRALGALLEEVLSDTLADHPAVGEIRGMGLFWAIELVDDRATKAPFSRRAALLRALREVRLLLHVEGSTLIFAPPFTVDGDLLNLMVERFHHALNQAMHH